MASTCPPHNICPTQKLNKDNSGELQLSSHRKFVQAARNDAKEPSTMLPSDSKHMEPSSQSSAVPESKPVHGNAHKRCALSEGSGSDTDEDNSKNSQRTPQPQQKKSKKKSKKKKTTSQSIVLLPYSSIISIKLQAQMLMRMEFLLTFISRLLVLHFFSYTC